MCQWNPCQDRERKVDNVEKNLVFSEKLIIVFNQKNSIHNYSISMVCKGNTSPLKSMTQE